MRKKKVKQMNEEKFAETIEAIENNDGYGDWQTSKASSIGSIFGRAAVDNYIGTSDVPNLIDSPKEDQLNILYYYAYVFPMLDLK